MENLNEEYREWAERHNKPLNEESRKEFDRFIEGNILIEVEDNEENEEETD